MTRVVAQKIRIPEELLVCKEEPRRFDKWPTNEEAAEYILTLEEAGDDCRSRLKSIKELNDE